MPLYVALLRGIGPTNPNMRGEKLRECFLGLGFTDVQTVIASGNVIFKTRSTNVRALETKIEKELPKQLGFTSTTIIRSKKELEELTATDPFAKTAKPKDYTIVTFFKHPTTLPFALPHKGVGSVIIKMHKKSALMSIVNIQQEKTPDFMRVLEKTFGKEITTRTWRTVWRILRTMEKQSA